MSSPVAGGKVIGTPYAGTHAKDFNVSGGSDNWESENAVDIAVPIGTPVYATQNGTIGPQFGAGGSGRFAGLRLHVNSDAYSEYYAHLSRYAPGIKPGVAVTAGELLGYSGVANGVAHLHYATSEGTDPLSLVKGLPEAVAGAVTGAGSSSSSSDGVPPAVASAAGCLLYVVAVGPLLVLGVGELIRAVA